MVSLNRTLSSKVLFLPRKKWIVDSHLVRYKIKRITVSALQVTKNIIGRLLRETI